MTDELRRPSELSPEQSRIRQATEAIRAMADEVADGLPTKRRMSAKLRQITLETPLQSLPIAFLLAVLVARRW